MMTIVMTMLIITILYLSEHQSLNVALRLLRMAASTEERKIKRRQLELRWESVTELQYNCHALRIYL